MIRRLPFKQVDWLIGTAVLGSVALVWAVLIALDSFTTLAREVDAIGRGSYSLSTALTFTALTAPRRAYDMFGTASVIGALMGLGALAPTAELTAMRAGGLSKLRICLGAVAAMLLLAALVALMGETIAPYAEQRAQSLAAGAKSRDLIATGRTGVWAREGETLINAKRGRDNPEGVELFDVRLYDFTPQGKLTRISQAESALLTQGSWTLRKVTRMSFAPEAVVSETLATLALKSALDPRLLTLSIIRPRNLALRDLAVNIDYMRSNKLDASEFVSAYWGRIFFPLNVLVLVFAALPFAFGTLRSGGFGKRLFLGVILATAWYFFQRGVENVADVYQLDYRLVHALPAAVLLGFAFVYFKRAG